VRLPARKTHHTKKGLVEWLNVKAQSSSPSTAKKKVLLGEQVVTEREEARRRMLKTNRTQD
jgi:hypothetical protein